MNEDIKGIKIGNIYNPSYSGGGSRDEKHRWDIIYLEDKGMLRIRKLVPAECFILMGFTKEDADKLSAAGISNTQLYKMAGNSIVVPVLEGIFKEVYQNG